MTAAASPDPEQVRQALDSVRPMILGHGGDAEVTEIENGVVRISFSGACSCCPNVAMTFVGPVRTALMQVPGVVEVRCASVHAGPRALARMARLLGAHPYGEAAPL